MIATDGKEFTLGVDFDRKAGDLAVVSELIAKPGTALAKTHRDAKPTVSRLGTLSKDAAFFLGMTSEMPKPLEFEKDFGSVAEEIQKTLQRDNIKIETEKIEKLLKDLIAAVDPESFDFAVALYPAKDQKSAFVAGIGIRDGRKGDALVQELMKLIPKDQLDAIKISTEKLGLATAYRIEPTNNVDPELKMLFGKAEVLLVVAPDKVFVGMGPDVESRIKAAMDGKPERAPLFVIDMSLADLLLLLEAAAKNDQERAEVKKVREALGKDLVRMRLFHVTRTTGDSVKYRAGIDILTPIKWAVALQKAGINIMPKPVKP